MTKIKFDITSWLLLLILSVIWGSSFILIKKGLIAFSPEQVATLRISISFIAVIPFAIKGLKDIPRKKMFGFIIMALLGNTIPPFLFSVAQTRIDSSVAGVLNGLTPLFTLVIGILFFSTKSSLFKAVGVLIGLIGATALIIFDNAPGDDFIRISYDLTINSRYALYVVLATFFYGISVNILKKYFQNVPPISITTMIFILIGPPAMIYLFTTDFIHVLQTKHHAMESLIYIAILAVVGTAIATALFFRLVQRTNALFGSTVTYMIPVVAVMWGVLDGEWFGLINIAGMLLIIFGVYLAGGSKSNQ